MAVNTEKPKLRCVDTDAADHNCDGVEWRQWLRKYPRRELRDYFLDRKISRRLRRGSAASDQKRN
jgi:hypothetical protein